MTALRAGVREYIGNLAPFMSDRSDLEWFTALSALGLPPATVVEIINRLRIATGRETEGSLAYIGDAANGPWPAPLAAGVKLRAVGAEAVELTWKGAGIRVAALPGERWWVAARVGRITLDSDARHGGSTRVLLAPSATTAASYCLVPEPRIGTGVTSLILRIGVPHPDPNLDQVLSAIRQLRWLETIPAFQRALRGSAGAVEEVVGDLHIRPDTAIGTARSLQVVNYLKHAQEEAASAFDVAIVRTAARRSESHWDLSAEYLASVMSRRITGTRCPICGGRAFLHRVKVSPVHCVRRHQLQCPECAIVYDIPDWNLSLEWVTRPSVRSGALEATVEVRNRSQSALLVAVALQVEAAEPLYRRRPTTLKLSPGGRSQIMLRFAARHPLENFWLSKVYVATGAAVGCFCYPLFFPNSHA
jgi:hypothetical protein